MKIKPVIQLILVLLSMQAIAQQPVTEANFRLADNWTVKKQFQRIRNIWTVPVWSNNGELFYYKHVEHDTVHHYLVNPERKSKVNLFEKTKLGSLLETSLDTVLDCQKIFLNDIRLESGIHSIFFRFKNREYEFNYAVNKLGSGDVKIKQEDVNVVQAPDKKKETEYLGK